MSKEEARQAGARLCEEGNFSEAIVVYEKALKRNKDQHELLYAQAKALFKVKRYQESLKNFDLLVTFFPGQAELISERAVLYHHVGDNQRALTELDRAAALEPENPFRYSSRAWIKAALKDITGAIADYEKAIELDPEDAIAYNNKGLLEDQLGRKQSAIKSFEKSNEITGYKPEIKEEDLPTPDPQPVVSVDEPKEKGLSFSHVSQTVKSLLTNPDERKEFWSFLKKMGKK